MAQESPRSLPSTPAEWRPARNPWVIALAVMLATFMEVLDTSVAIVSLPYIAGSLSATNEEATWVLTSYLIANAIILPASGWFGVVFGRKRFLIACIVVFTASSALAGASESLVLLIAARTLQGAGGGALQPISQAVLLESFPPLRRGVAMAAFAMGVVVAPTIGPTLGGWITENYSWRWIFYINLPIGILALLMVHTFVEDPPYVRKGREAARSRVDATGFCLMALWLSTLQVILDKGQEEDWLSSTWICWFAAISAVSFIAFVVRELTAASPIVDLRVLRDRNFASGILFMSILGGVLYGMITLLPLFLQTLLGYTSLECGYAMSPRGIGAFIGTLFVGRLTQAVDNRLLIGLGFLLLAASCAVFGGVNLEVAFPNIVWPNFINGLAMSLLFVPLTTTTMGTLRNEQMGNATGIFNLMRNIGGSIGISAVTTFIARDSQAHQAMLVGHLTPYDPAMRERLREIATGLAPQVGSHEAGRLAYGVIYDDLVTQATLWAYVDAFRWIALICLACVPAALAFRRVRRGRPTLAH